jgi:DNA ligase-associated metallophosphoesterase
MHAEIFINNETFWLLPERALWWPARQALFIADVHLGKSSHFRKNGIQLLSDIAYRELENLNALVKKMQPKQLVFLGDLFHSDVNHEWGLFTDWLQHQSAEAILVNGNHDAALLKSVHLGKLQSVEKLILGNFLFTHEPEEGAGGSYNFCGHIHPGFVLKGKAAQRLRMPCFNIGPSQGILPAFGLTTGFVTQNPKAKHRYFVIAPDEVFEIN